MKTLKSVIFEAKKPSVKSQILMCDDTKLFGN